MAKISINLTKRKKPQETHAQTYFLVLVIFMHILFHNDPWTKVWVLFIGLTHHLHNFCLKFWFFRHFSFSLIFVEEELSEIFYISQVLILSLQFPMYVFLPFNGKFRKSSLVHDFSTQILPAYSPSLLKTNI